MPDEDPNIGSPQETSQPQSTPAPESSPALESTPSDQRSSEGENFEESETHTDSQPLSNTVGEALKLFEENKTTARTGLPVARQAQARPPRDYSGLSQEETSWFKNMGGRAFDALKPVYLEYKKLKGEIDTLRANSAEATKNSFFEHENAYQVMPDYQQFSANLAQLDAEASHWTKQLAAIEAGENWTPIVLDAKGNPVLGEEQPPSAQAKAVVLNALTQAHILKTDVSNKMGEVRNNFSSNHKNFISKLADIEKKIFEGADPAVLDKAMATKLPIFPAHMHGNPIVRSLAKSLAVIDGLVAMLNEARGARNTNILKAKTATAAGPGNNIIQTPAGGGKGNTVGAIMDEFAKAKAMGQA